MKSKPGPKPGYKQSPEHVAKRREAQLGEKHHAWVGERVSARGGRTRALRMYPEIGPCVRCGSARSERHHRDGNTANNSEANVIPLCRKCHMAEDGRLEQVRRDARANQRRAVAVSAASRARILHCPRGHPYAGSNLYIKNGARNCRRCLNDYKRNKRASEALLQSRGDNDISR